VKKAWRVRLDEPSWWYPQTPSRVATFLQPLGALYGWAAAARYFRATPYRSRLPIICIGNFTAGGTGKTPLAVYLCERLKAAGHEPATVADYPGPIG
jgi:tetraacyldisaccharide 4'-kinase